MSEPRPRKLLLVINELSRDGGAEAQLAHLARGLADLGHMVTICCIDTSFIDLQSFTKRGIEVISLGVTTRGGRAKAVPRLARLARQAEVVHCTMWDPSLWGRIAAILAHRPVVVADHATDRSVQVATNGAQRGNWIALHNRLLDRFTFATVACASSQRQVLASEGVNPEKIVHIPNGIPVEEVIAAAVDGPSKADLGLPEDALIAMQVGVFRPEKNQLGAIESFANLLERVPDAHLVLVGDGPSRPEIERRAGEIAADKIHFLGFRSDIPALLALADVMLLPSISDAMPMVVLEAMALGVPTVATDVGDVREVLAGGAGVCVATNDTAAFAAAVGDLLMDPERREEMSAVAKGSAGNFDSAAMAHRYAALFEAACTGVLPTVAVREAIPDAVA